MTDLRLVFDDNLGIGLPWPSPKLSRGKPSRVVQWQRLLYREVRAGRPLAEGITAQPPSSWQPDMVLRGSDVELHDLEQASVKRESAAADSSLGPVKRQKVHLEQFVKDWFHLLMEMTCLQTCACTTLKTKSGDSFVEFVRFVRFEENPSGAPHPWVLIQDFASIHRSAATLARLMR